MKQTPAGSPMNLSLHMTQTPTAASAETTSTAEIAIVMYPGETAHPPDESGTWEQITTFTPDPTATYTVKTGHGHNWAVHAEGIAIFQKRT